ncbi:MAG TPA: HDOD domain-containing protein [Gemmatimonas sp.]|uniref:HDOD domain-containing protein n=1 Tax=Gemmatimonas sp. TaxID=1962908 RepID=UPI002EDB100E
MKDFIIRATLSRVGALATLPDVALRIMRVAENPAATEEMVHDILISDPSLAARVLKVVNSAFYRRQREVSTPRAAIRLLGVEAIRSIALAASLHRLFRGRRSIVGFDPADLWAHSVAVGTAARAVSLRTGIGLPEEAMLAGLLHDIGIIVAMQAWLPEFTLIMQRAGTPGAPTFRELELEQIGATHEQFGGALCDAWNFPPSLGLACRYHHDFSGLSGDEQRWAALIHLADVLAAQLGIGYVHTVESSSPHPGALSVLGIDSIELESLLDELETELPHATTLLAA